MEREHEGSEQYVKRVVLPSGRTIDVVLFRDSTPGPAEHVAPAELPPAADIVEDEQELHLCVHCDSSLVYPVEWDEVTGEAWRVTLRCPECETFREGVFSQDSVDAFDEELDAGCEMLTSDLRRLARANMAEDTDRFAAALQAGAILPEDF